MRAKRIRPTRSVWRLLFRVRSGRDPEIAGVYASDLHAMREVALTLLSGIDAVPNAVLRGDPKQAALLGADFEALLRFLRATGWDGETEPSGSVVETMQDTAVFRRVLQMIANYCDEVLDDDADRRDVEFSNREQARTAHQAATMLRQRLRWPIRMNTQGGDRRGG